mmetsp:Transcript_64761/g.181041  ORF Transcript_64761/g.181041 Transcript_64761/m.181041 type:complete len:247 (+) Transcript_64761:187-927(+)
MVHKRADTEGAPKGGPRGGQGRCHTRKRPFPPAIWPLTIAPRLHRTLRIESGAGAPRLRIGPARMHCGCASAGARSPSRPRPLPVQVLAQVLRHGRDRFAGQGLPEHVHEDVASAPRFLGARLGPLQPPRLAPSPAAGREEVAAGAGVAEGDGDEVPAGAQDPPRLADGLRDDARRAGVKRVERALLDHEIELGVREGHLGDVHGQPRHRRPSLGMPGPHLLDHGGGDVDARDVGVAVLVHLLGKP